MLNFSQIQSVVCLMINIKPNYSQNKKNSQLLTVCETEIDYIIHIIN